MEKINERKKWRNYAVAQGCLFSLACFLLAFFPLYSVYESGGLQATQKEMHCFFMYAQLDDCPEMQGWNACSSDVHNTGGEDCTNFFTQLGIVATYNTICMICYILMLIIMVGTTVVVSVADLHIFVYFVDFNVVHRLVVFFHFVLVMLGSIVIQQTDVIVESIEYSNSNAAGSQEPEFGAASIFTIIVPILFLISDVMYAY
jgi:hypothetical protein